jgi:hypothetical protein
MDFILSVRGSGTGIPHYTETGTAPLLKPMSGYLNGPILTYIRGEDNQFYSIFPIQEANAVSFLGRIVMMDRNNQSDASRV